MNSQGDRLKCNFNSQYVDVKQTGGFIESTIQFEALQELLREDDKNKLKIFCRSNDLDEIRNHLWYLLLSKNGPMGSDEEVSEEVTRNHDYSDGTNKLPSWVDPLYCRYYNLNQEGQHAVSIVLWSIADEYPQLTYSPLIFPITALFLHFFSIQKTKLCLLRLLEIPFGGIFSQKSEDHLLTETRTEYLRSVFVLIKLTNQFGVLPQRQFFVDQRKRLKKNRIFDECFMEWAKWIWIGLPFEYVLRIFDCFMVEGNKFLFRIALALLVLYRRTFHTSSGVFSQSMDPGIDFSTNKMLNFCKNISINPNQLIKFSLRITRLSASKISNEHSNFVLLIRQHPDLLNIVSSSSVAISPTSDMLALKSFKITNAMRTVPKNFNSSIIDRQRLHILFDWLPENIVVKTPIILFCSNEDGYSLTTIFGKSHDYEPTILLIKTTKNEKFGAFCSTSWAERESHPHNYFGTGETFLFSLHPKVAFYPWVGSKEYGGNAIVEIKHTSELFMSANSSMLSVGGGNGIGLWLNSDLSKGSTQACDTFKNLPLSPTSNDFMISVIEIIGFE